MGLTWQEPLIPTEKETQKHGAPSVLYPKHWPGIRHKQQVTSHFRVSGNLFLGLKIDKYWKPTKWRAAFPPNRGLTWQAVIFKGPHILIQVKFLRLILLPSLWLPFATVRRKKNWAWVEWPPFGNKGLHFLPGHSWKLQFDQSAETLTCCVSGPDKGATNLDVWWSVLPFSVTAAAVGSPLARQRRANRCSRDRKSKTNHHTSKLVTPSFHFVVRAETPRARHARVWD